MQLLLGALVLAAAPAQTPEINALIRESVELAERAKRYYDRAEYLMARHGFERQACINADNAVTVGIKSWNRVIAAKKLAANAAELARINEIRDIARDVLNSYKTLYNENCGNEPYELTK